MPCIQPRISHCVTALLDSIPAALEHSVSQRSATFNSPISHRTTSPVSCDADYILMLSSVSEYNLDISIQRTPAEEPRGHSHCYIFSHHLSLHLSFPPQESDMEYYDSKAESDYVSTAVCPPKSCPSCSPVRLVVTLVTGTRAVCVC